MTGAEIIKPKSNLELVQEAILLVTNIYKEDIFKPLAQALTTGHKKLKITPAGNGYRIEFKKYSIVISTNDSGSSLAVQIFHLQKPISNFYYNPLSKTDFRDKEKFKEVIEELQRILEKESNSKSLIAKFGKGVIKVLGKKAN